MIQLKEEICNKLITTQFNFLIFPVDQVEFHLPGINPVNTFCSVR